MLIPDSGLGFTEPGINPNASNIKGFFNWQGNNLSFAQSAWLTYLIIAITFLSVIVIWIYKGKIYSYLNLKNGNVKIFKIFRSKNQFFQFIGYIGMFFLVLRIIILGIGNYPNLWELLPLHFCRMFIFLTFLAFIFKKSFLTKYFAFFSISGAIVGLFISDLSNSNFWGAWTTEFPVQFGRGGFDIGLDSYIFWDYFLAHTFALIMPIIILTTTSKIIRKKDSWISIISLLTFTIFIFFLNWILFTYASAKWKSNFFYIGLLDQINIFGILSDWPYALFLYTGLGLIFYYTIFWIWILQDKVDFKFEKKWVLKKILIQKSKNFYKYTNKV